MLFVYTYLLKECAKPPNAPELFAQPDIDGGLIGVASLNADDFLSVVLSASK